MYKINILCALLTYICGSPIDTEKSVQKGWYARTRPRILKHCATDRRGRATQEELQLAQKREYDTKNTAL